ncbi:MAG: putative DNA binding domain-containing protein [Clostridium sp.]|nr:putative DNA binding domain-containing protein [Clostridium sp.]MCM1460546.1 putative DNA binding domain-containing protein [Bacteroides sp.]
MAESQNIEWKESWRDEYLKWICGFANAGGGKIYIGIDDTGKVTGIRNGKRLLEEIPNKIQTNLGFLADVNLLSENGLEYIEIIVSPSSYPVSYKGEYHFRSGSTKQVLRGTALNEFISSKTGIRWEDSVIEGVTVEDLDKESFDIFRREAVRSKRMTKDDLNMSNAELLDSLDLLKDGKLTRAAVLLFHRTPQKWMFGTYTKIGRFGKGSDLLYQDEVIGSLFMQAERVIELIYLKYLKAPITYDNLIRVETYPFPKDAVREALYNALVHSRWSAGIPIQVRIEDDAMYISNECVFPSDWTMDSLLQRHQSRPYNPKIARAFFRAGYIESWGRGIQKIFDVCNEYGTLQPEYVVHSEDIMIKLSAVSTSNERFLKPNAKAGHTALKIKIVECLKEKPTATQKELQETLNETRTHIQGIVKELVNEGTIERKGGKRFGFWEVKK